MGSSADYRPLVRRTPFGLRLPPLGSSLLIARLGHERPNLGQRSKDDGNDDVIRAAVNDFSRRTRWGVPFKCQFVGADNFRRYQKSDQNLVSAKNQGTNGQNTTGANKEHLVNSPTKVGFMQALKLLSKVTALD